MYHLSSVRVPRWLVSTAGSLFLSLVVGTGCGEDAQPSMEGNTPGAGVAEAGPANEASIPETLPGPEGSSTRIVFLGTSLTAGYGLDDPERDAWPQRVQFLADSAGIPVQVVNAGVSGETSAGGVRRIDWVLQEPLDALVVELGANDGLRGLQVDDLEENLSQILGVARAAYPDARLFLVQMEAPPNMGRAYTTAFHDVYPRVARDHGATLIPFILEEVAAVPELNQSDGIHPVPAGHDMMARVAWTTLEPVLREMTSSR